MKRDLAIVYKTELYKINKTIIEKHTDSATIKNMTDRIKKRGCNEIK